MSSIYDYQQSFDMAANNGHGHNLSVPVAYQQPVPVHPITQQHQQQQQQQQMQYYQQYAAYQSQQQQQQQAYQQNANPFQTPYNYYTNHSNSNAANQRYNFGYGGNAVATNGGSKFYPSQQPQQLPVAPAPAPVGQAQEEAPVTGGVCAVLDYDLNSMSKYICNLAFNYFGRNDFKSNQNFERSVYNVLNATRLPLTSLLMSNHYFYKIYMKNPSMFAATNSNNSNESIYKNIIISLVLANKANDDNTFTNKSWAAATGLHASVINQLEVAWLECLNWTLHDFNLNSNQVYLSHYQNFINKETIQSPINSIPQQQQQAPIPQIQLPVSPISDQSCTFSPIRDRSTERSRSKSPIRYDYSSCNNDRSNSWNSSYNYNNFYNHRKNRSSFSISYNNGLEFEYCTSTGSYNSSPNCGCHFCVMQTKKNIWAYNKNPTTVY